MKKMVIILTIINVVYSLLFVYFYWQHKNLKSSDPFFYDGYTIEKDLFNDYLIDKTKEFIITLRPNIHPNTAEVMAYSVVKAAKEYNINPFYLTSVAFVESSFNINAISQAGAVGLFQVMPFNIRDKNTVAMGLNAHDGARILRECLDATGNNCITAYVCYIYGRNGYKLKIDSSDVPPTVGKLATIILLNSHLIQKCWSFM